MKHRKWTKNRINSEINKVYNNRKIIGFYFKKQSFTKNKKAGFKYSFYVECLKCGRIKSSYFYKILKAGCKNCNLKGKQHKDRKDVEILSSAFLYRNYKRSALKRNIKFKLTKKQFKNMLHKNCKYCGAKNANTIYRGGRKYCYNGVDRVDSLLDYNKNNCVSCCAKCNYAKKKMTTKEFLYQVRKIYKFQNKLN